MKNVLGRGARGSPVTMEVPAAGATSMGPTSPALADPPRRRRRVGRRWGVVVVVVVALAGGGYAYASTRTKPASYVLGAARLATISQVVGVSGALQAVRTWTLDFPTSGVVSAVEVTPGEKVRAGQTLASLDTSSLRSQLASAQAALASAQAKLASDQAGPSASQLASAKAQVASAQTALANDDTNLTIDEQSLAVDQASLAADQATLTSGPGAGQAVPSYSTGESLSATESLLAADEQLAADDGASAQPSVSSPSAGGTKVSGGSGSTGSSGSSASGGGSVSSSPAPTAQAAVAAASKVVGDLEQISSAQGSLSAASAALSAISSPTPSSTVIADQDAVTAAQDQLSIAKANLAGSTLAAPAAAEVAEVNVSAGQSVSGGGSTSPGTSGPAGSSGTSGSAGGSSGGSSGAGSSGGSSSTGAIVLYSPGSYLAVADVSDAQIGQVHLGQRALVTPAGQTAPILGSVTSITPTATTTSGVAAYPVDVTLKSDPGGLFEGMTAQVSIVITRASGVLAVPSSAVHTLGSHNFVLVLRNGKRVDQPIKIGASGGGLTQITSGLHAGEPVVLANARAALPSSRTTPSPRPAFAGRGFGGGFGGFVGGGGPGGKGAG